METQTAVLIALSILLLLLLWQAQSKRTLNGDRVIVPAEDYHPVPQTPALLEYEATHKALALAVTCIDYRFVADTVDLLERTTLSRMYDYSVVPGVALGLNLEDNPFASMKGSWRSSFLDYVQLAVELHSISKVILVSHESCGCYKAVYGDWDSPEHEVALHRDNLQKFVVTMKKLAPMLETSGYFLRLDGSIQRLA